MVHIMPSVLLRLLHVFSRHIFHADVLSRCKANSPAAQHAFFFSGFSEHGVITLRKWKITGLSSLDCLHMEAKSKHLG